MSPRDWQDLASVLLAGERTTWGWQNPAAGPLGAALHGMAVRCNEIAAERNILTGPGQEA